MNRMLSAVLSGAMLVTVAGCTKVQVVTPEIRGQMLADLKAGRLTLDCGIACRFAWNSSVGRLNALDTSENWEELAVEVMQIGYSQDLAYYYIGQAAQGLGYHEAAIKYYRYAGALANSGDVTASCAYDQITGCQGVTMATALPFLIDASQKVLAQQSGAPAPAPSANSGWVMPPPPKK